MKTWPDNAVRPCEPAGRPARVGNLGLFATAARRYWLGVFPVARRTRRFLLAHAEAIPDPLLRAEALASHHDKSSNSEGLAAFAILAPPSRRSEITRSLVAYQLLLDYLDGVSERPCDQPMAAGLRLHKAFEVALDPGAAHSDYYELAPGREDAGYLVQLIETCRASLRDLPSYGVVQGPLLRQARLCGESQSFNHALGPASVERSIAEWAATTSARAGLEVELEWWELLAAAAASSLCIGALLALAAAPGASQADASRVEAAYFPWATGLNALLDSLIDLEEDPEDCSHIRRYRSDARAAERLGMMATHAREQVSMLPDGEMHAAILAAMGAMYLSHGGAWQAGGKQISLAVCAALGPLVRPSLVVHLLRRGGRGSAAVIAATRRSEASW